MPQSLSRSKCISRGLVGEHTAESNRGQLRPRMLAEQPLPKRMPAANGLPSRRRDWLTRQSAGQQRSEAEWQHNRTSQTDPLDQSTYFQYDVLNRLTVITDALSLSAYYVYDANGNLMDQTLATGAVNYFQYDVLDQRSKVLYGDGAYSYFLYDANGNLTDAGSARGDAGRSYDSFNRITQDLAPDGDQVDYSYDAVGRLSTLDSSAESLTYTYDAAGRMIDVTNSQPEAYYYQYDAAGNLATKLLNNGVASYFQYDDAGRTTAIRNCFPDGSPLVSWRSAAPHSPRRWRARGRLARARLEYNYDDASRIDRVRRKSGTHIYYAYDNADRLTGEHWVDSGDSTIYAFGWDYDGVGNRTYQNQDGVKS